MNKKFFFSLSSLALAIVLAVCGVSVYAWFSATDRASEMEFKFARINSEVYFYRANDENKNGVPDRIEEGYWTDKNIANFPEAYFPEFRGAYSFEFIGKREAKVEDLVTTEDTISFSGGGNSLADIVPSKVFTYRFRMVNKGDSTNNVSIFINAGSGATKDQAKLLLKTLAVSCGEVVVKRDTTGNASVDTVRFSGYQYLNQIKDGGSLRVLSDYPLSGMDAQMAEDKKANNEKQIVNTRDFWIRFQMIPYEELIKNNIISEAELPKDTYQSLQGSTIDKLIDFSVLFEVKTPDPSASA